MKSELVGSGPIPKTKFGEFWGPDSSVLSDEKKHICFFAKIMNVMRSSLRKVLLSRRFRGHKLAKRNKTFRNDFHNRGCAVFLLKDIGREEMDDELGIDHEVDATRETVRDFSFRQTWECLGLLYWFCQRPQCFQKTCSDTKALRLLGSLEKARNAH